VAATDGHRRRWMRLSSCRWSGGAILLLIWP
jgi:hypothetical protein